MVDRVALLAENLRRLGLVLFSRAKIDDQAPPSPWQASPRHVGLDFRFLPGGARRDIHVVRRAAAAAQNRHRERWPERSVLSLCPEIRRGTAKGRLSVEVRETAGSVENLRLLGQTGSGVAVAIVQSGVASPDDVEQFYALGSMYREPLWVFYRGDKRLERLASSRANASVSVRKAAAPMRSPCNCWPSMA